MSDTIETIPTGWKTGWGQHHRVFDTVFFLLVTLLWNTSKKFKYILSILLNEIIIIKSFACFFATILHQFLIMKQEIFSQTTTIGCNSRKWDTFQWEYCACIYIVSTREKKKLSKLAIIKKKRKRRITHNVLKDLFPVFFGDLILNFDNLVFCQKDLNFFLPNWNIHSNIE